jgi:lysophospholipase L1-like esterase
LEAQPRKIFFMGGVNDLSGNRPVEEVASNIRKILEMVREKAPACQVYLQSVITPNNEVLAYAYIKNKQHLMNELNAKLKAEAELNAKLRAELAEAESRANPAAGLIGPAEVRTEV